MESSPSSEGETPTGREDEKTLSETEILPPESVCQENVSTTEQTKRDLFDQNKTRKPIRMDENVKLQAALKVDKLNISINDTVKVTEEMLVKLPKSRYNLPKPEYDSNETIAYYPISEDLPKKAH